MSVAGSESSVNLTACLSLAGLLSLTGRGVTGCLSELAAARFIADEAAVCVEMTAALCANEASLSASLSLAACSLCRQS